jgi:hypothetical protein
MHPQKEKRYNNEPYFAIYPPIAPGPLKNDFYRGFTYSEVRFDSSA